MSRKVELEKLRDTVRSTKTRTSPTGTVWTTSMCRGWTRDELIEHLTITGVEVSPEQQQ